MHLAGQRLGRFFGGDTDGLVGAYVHERGCNFSTRVVEAEFRQAQHGESHAENLSGAEVTVSLLGLAEVFVEGFHKSSRQLSAFSLTLPALVFRGGNRVTFGASAHRLCCSQ